MNYLLLTIPLLRQLVAITLPRMSKLLARPKYIGFVVEKAPIGTGFLQIFGFPSQYHSTGGPGSSVGIATGYELDGPEIDSLWRRDFPHLSRPTVEPTHLSVQWVPSLSQG
jgi:hypothetical protein